MLGALSPYATQYLTILMVTTTLLFALPIFLAPLQWAQLMRWNLPSDTDLAVYFGRCLGAFILIVEWVAFRALCGQVELTTAFDVMFAVFALMIPIHVYGALRHIQPLSETLEIGFWLLLVVLNALFYPR